MYTVYWKMLLMFSHIPERSKLTQSTTKYQESDCWGVDGKSIYSSGNSKNYLCLQFLVGFQQCSRPPTPWRFLRRGQRQNLYSAGNPSLVQLEQADENLFYNIRYNTNHSLHYLLPKQTERSYSLRSRSHNFELSCIHDDRNFIDRMLFKAYHTV